jgi:hypothetical protein
MMKNREQAILMKKRSHLTNEVLNIKGFIRGTLVKTKKKCGRKSCRCEQGQLHPHVYISTSRNKKNQIIYIKPDEMETAQQHIDNYRKLLGILDEISQINVALLKLKN